LLTRAVRYGLEDEVMKIRNAFIELNRAVDSAIF